MTKLRGMTARLLWLCGVLGVLGGCHRDLDLCADTDGTCLTVQVVTSSQQPIDLLRGIFRPSTGSGLERHFQAPDGQAVLPAAFALPLGTVSGQVRVDVVGELALAAKLKGGTQLAVDPGQHKFVEVMLTEVGAGDPALPFGGPEPRFNAGVTFGPLSAVGPSVVLFGGIGRGGFPLDDTWLWDPSTGLWSRALTSIFPEARSASLGYDPVQSRAVLVGGALQNGQGLSDVWTFDGMAWTQQRSIKGPLKPRPGGTLVVGQVAALGPVGLHFLYYGDSVAQALAGDELYFYKAPGTDFLARTLQPMTAGQMVPKLQSPKLIFVGGSLYLVGADDVTMANVSVFALTPTAGVLDVSTTFRVDDLGLLDAANGPAVRSGFSVAADPATRQIFVFGGASANGTPSGALYAFSLDTKKWTALGATPMPTARKDAQLVGLPGSSALLFSGHAGDIFPTDNWRLDSGVWRRLQ